MTLVTPPPFSLPLGANQSPPDSRDYPARMRLANVHTAGALPTKDKLSWMPPVITQTVGSCVAMSDQQAAAIDEHTEAGGCIRLNDESWYYELWAEQNPSVPFQDTGLVPRWALDSWVKQGPPVPVGERSHYRIRSYYAVAGWDEIRRVITEKRKPVLVTSRIALSWPETTAVGQLLPFDYYGDATPDPWVGLHQWLVWAYNEAPTLGLCFRSTWGAQIGLKGNFYMSHRDFEASFIEAWYVESVRP